MTKREWICFFKGHHDKEQMGDCERCGKDYNEWIETCPANWYWKRKKISEWFFRKCDTCGKADIFFGRIVGDHSKCLPF